MPADKRKKPTTKRARINEAPDAATKRAAIEILKPKTGPETPPLGVLIKLGSLAVHVEELTEVVGGFEELRRCILSGARGRDARAADFDLQAIRPLLEDAELREWFAAMGALLPVKRSKR
jgi:hypothetical protein